MQKKTRLKAAYRIAAGLAIPVISVPAWSNRQVQEAGAKRDLIQEMIKFTIPKEKREAVDHVRSAIW